MNFKLTWLADVLRAAGLTVVEHAGWQARGLGEMGTVRGVLDHHTAGPANATGTPSLNLIINGRGGPNPLRGPLSHTYLARDGVWHVIAAGRCNHAGAGSWHGASGNSAFIGVEAENAGTGNDPWPEVQMDSYERGVAPILKRLGVGAEMVAGHKEYATPRGRKIDPTFDMGEFREDVAAHMQGVAAPARPVASVDPVHAMLKRGAKGHSVRDLQVALDRAGFELADDGDFGKKTEDALKAFQRSKGLIADGVAGPKTWVALGF